MMQFSPKINKLKFKHQSFALDYSGVANGDLFEKDRTTYTENFLCKIIPGWFGLKSTLIGPSIFSSQPIRMSKTLKHYFYTRIFLYNKIGSLFEVLFLFFCPCVYPQLIQLQSYSRQRMLYVL